VSGRSPDPNFPRGVQAFLFEAAERRRRVEERLVGLVAAAGFREVILPMLDYAAPYRGVTAEGDERVYRLIDREGQLLAVRADFTPMAARSLAPRLAAAEGPVAVYYRGDVVRDEEAGVGRPREFAQVGAELYGDASEAAETRMLALLLSALSGVPAPRLRVTLGWAGLLPKLLATIAPSLTRGAGERLAEAAAAARARQVAALLQALREAGAPAAAAEEVGEAVLVGFDPASRLFALPVLAGPAAALARAVRETRAAAPEAAVVVDLAGTPTAPYYTGLTVAVDALGAAGAIAGGGRYDDLLANFGAPRAAFGFSIGVEALASALELVDGGAAARPFRIAAGKGRLLPRALAVLRDAGVAFPEPDGRRLLVPDESGAFELLLLKDDDVPTYVAHGGADAGIVGSDRVAESGEPVFAPLDLPFGACRLSLIGRKGEAFSPDGSPVRVGTKYRRLAARYFDGRGIPHEIVPLAGSVELAAALRLTDVVVDLIETGATLAANGLAEIETILESRAALVVGPRALATRRPEVARLVTRLRAGCAAAPSAAKGAA
jgi:ATP phosphoribosyltransferase